MRARNVKTYILLCVVAVLPHILSMAPARADQINPTDQRAIQSVIQSQLNAFLEDNGSAAYRHASPVIQGMFPDANIFMTMVKKGYPQIYRSQQAIFAPLIVRNGRYFQPVTIVGADGKVIRAQYQMIKQNDGRWRINGVIAQPAPGAGS